MLVARLLTGTACSLLLAACGGGAVSAGAGGTAKVDAASARATASADGSTSATPSPPGPGERARGSGVPLSEASTASGAPPAAAAAPAYDPKLVQQALDLSGSAPADERARLGLRLAVVEQGPDQPWLLAIVNRGTQPLRVIADLRTLVLEVTPRAPEPDPKQRARAKTPKPLICALPRDVSPKSADSTLEVELEPGEGLVDAFDPRLYCMSEKAASALAPGATVLARLGWPEKTKPVWRRGKQERVVLEQVPPFLARVRGEAPSMPKPQTAPAKPGLSSSASNVATPPAAPQSDAFGVKEIAAPAFTLGPEYAAPAAPAAPREPLALVLASGSDAPTEREATVTVALVNQSDTAHNVYFRRELVSFEVSGPSGFVSCEPGPDQRSPDRQSFSRLAPGRRLAARSRLIELCPAGALREPGLYLVHARFDATTAAPTPEVKPFRGRLVSTKPAAVRVRRGWGGLSGQRAPMRVRVGSGAQE